jgi:hypothetical protein
MSNKRAETYAVTLYEGVIRPLMQAGIDRKDRFIRVCCLCGRWWTGKGWQVTNLPVGNQTYTYCPLCYDEAIKQARIDMADVVKEDGLEAIKKEGDDIGE